MRTERILLLFFCAFLIVLWAGPVHGQKTDLSQSSVLVFADAQKAGAFLSIEDEYIRAMGRYDLQARLNRLEPVSREALLGHMAKQGRSWTAEEIELFKAYVNEIRPKLEQLELQLPDTVWLLKTSGLEEGGAPVAYTRRNGIVYTEGIIVQQKARLKEIFVHEIFHIFSRQNPALRQQLFEIIGFKELNYEVKLPEEWHNRRLTNPDAPLINAVMTLKHEDSTIAVTSFLHSSSPHYNPDKPGGIFQNFAFSLMETKKNNSGWEAVLKNGDPVLHSPGSLPSFWEHIGRNTQYIIHPEEILASNFEYLVLGFDNLPNPEIIEQMKAVILTGTAGD